MKRILICFLLVFFLFSGTAFAAPPADQAVEIRDDGSSVTVVTTNPTTYWESPRLKAGETITTPGTLTITNTTDIARPVFLQSVSFPYNNKAVLEYLNHLTLTATANEAVIYQAPYSQINDRSHLSAFNTILAPNASITYQLSLSCDYTYTGDKYADNSVLQWHFTTLLTEADLADKSDGTRNDSLLWQWLISVGISVVLTAVLIFRSEKAKQ